MRSPTFGKAVFQSPMGPRLWNVVHRLGKRRGSRPVYLQWVHVFGDITTVMARLNDKAFNKLVRRLVDLRLLRHSPGVAQYTLHPLVRGHYLDKLEHRDPVAVQNLHTRLMDFYLFLGGEDKEFPTLADLAPFIEAVHYACRAGEYDEANGIRRYRIDQDNRQVLIWQLGACDTYLALFQEFFPGSDFSQEPQVSHPADQAFILEGVGFALMSLGRLAAASPFFQRHNTLRLAQEDKANASIGCQNLCHVQTHLGDLAAARAAAAQALALARGAEDSEQEINSLVWQAWVAHLEGNLTAATAAFQQAEALERQLEPDIRYLYGLRGVRHADHLCMSGNHDDARKITEANCRICEEEKYIPNLSRCRRLLGDLAGDESHREEARGHYQAALDLARSITDRSVLIEALLTRGRWLARQGEAVAARRDLEEALDYATAGGYRLYEADLRVGLAWTHLQGGNPATAGSEAGRALALSAQMGYHWGRVDAQKALEVLHA